MASRMFSIFDSRSTKMGRIYEKSWGNICYEIVDEEAYERYWWGRKPSTREAFEAWLMDPEKTQDSVGREYGKWPSMIRLQLRRLLRREIIRRIPTARAQVHSRRSNNAFYAYIVP